MIKLELLAPAKDAETARVAINYGADAVYIGAQRFGARNGATNPMAEIEALTRYAHTYGAKIFLTLNTILYDNELEDARRTAFEAYDAGVDALIVQDMALLEMDLPPIELHASTQTAALTPERVKFLADAGFSRVILERAAGLDQIRDIRAASDVELEAFVHGAICVGYSGQCYLSQTLMGKSGNRGECAQPCRWTYNLLDENYKRMISDRHLLSVQDLNLSAYLPQLIDAGITSFKIEGRLKDHNYIKNSVANYRRILDQIIDGRHDLARASDGRTTADFTPAPERTFTRGFSHYFIDGNNKNVSSFNTPKAIGNYIGIVDAVRRDHVVLVQNEPLHAGDGICFTSREGEFMGTNINKVAGDLVYPNRMDNITEGTKIYRNYDHEFSLELQRSRTKRTVDASVVVDCRDRAITVTATDYTGFSVTQKLEGTFDVAQNVEKMRTALATQFAKSGETIFNITAVEVNIEGEAPFVPMSVLNDLRRRVLEALTQARLAGYKRTPAKSVNRAVSYPEQSLDFKANVVNQLSKKFYADRGVKQVDPGFEITDEHVGQTVMTCRYCIRRETGQCLVHDKPNYRGKLYIENNFHTFELKFDCKKCEMSLVYCGKRR